MAKSSETTIIDQDLTFRDSPCIFPGSVVIKGNVRDNTTVQANGDITVHGSVGKATLRASGNVIIRLGVSGKGYIDSGGSIRVKFVESSTLICKGDIVIGSSSMHSMISAGRSIIATKNRGAIIGGIAKAEKDIIAVRIGSKTTSTPTHLKVGIHPLLRSEFERLTEKRREMAQKLSQKKKDILYLRNLRDTADKQQISDRMSSRLENLPLFELQARKFFDAFKKCQKRLAHLNRVIASRTGTSHVSVTHEIFPNSFITIGWATLELKDRLQQVTFYEKNGKVLWHGSKTAKLIEDQR